MKNKKVIILVVLAVTMIAGYNVFNTQSSGVLSDLVLANVEALADNEGTGSDCNWTDEEYTSCDARGSFSGCPCGSDEW